MSGFTDLPAVLRRRKHALVKEGYPAEWLDCLTQAAAELVTRRRASTDDTQTALDAVADNRRLRNAMQQSYSLIMQNQRLLPSDREMILRPLGLAVRAVREPGQGRKIIAIEVGTNATRAFIEARVKEILDHEFPTGGPNVTTPEEGEQEENIEDAQGRLDAAEAAPQPRGAGPDTDQPAQPQASSEDPGGGAGHPASRERDDERADR